MTLHDGRRAYPAVIAGDDDRVTGLVLDRIVEAAGEADWDVEYVGPKARLSPTIEHWVDWSAATLDFAWVTERYAETVRQREVQFGRTDLSAAPRKLLVVIDETPELLAQARIWTRTVRAAGLCDMSFVVRAKDLSSSGLGRGPLRTALCASNVVHAWAPSLDANGNALLVMGTGADPRILRTRKSEVLVKTKRFGPVRVTVR